MYADVVTRSMSHAIEETRRRRDLQRGYNDENGITPESIVKPVDATLLEMTQLDYYEIPLVAEEVDRYGSPREIEQEILKLSDEMKQAAQKFEFEKAAQFRDRIKLLRETHLQLAGGPEAIAQGQGAG